MTHVPHSRDALTRGFLILDSLFLIEEGARGVGVGRCPLKRSGLSGLGVRLRIAHAKVAKDAKGGFDLEMRNAKCEIRNFRKEKDGEEDWLLGIGDWRLEIRDWRLGIGYWGADCSRQGREAPTLVGVETG